MRAKEKKSRRWEWLDMLVDVLCITAIVDFLSGD
jgi:hypothetical protein